ncbi:MFS transporter [Thiopseudomonas acetoxidans]|uniref:MFS transporter n=1 Tax=Thiopseudomonas acetoxidans TaxID=3041622 RepID=A0ABT7SPH8_9GAMM|nr:MFS transporter [Thiopseudomonas sp. CY1220]MDM7858098.1 MFS transporter [Thiopseudomonas sp. CY1220]
MPITVWGLAIAQALLGTGNILLVAVSALIGKELATHPAQITLPMAFQFLGVIAATLPAAHIMQHLGRKVGFLLGNSIGLFGAWVALQGLHASDIWLFAVGTMLIGVAIGTSQQYRFAALDCAPNHRSRAISMVMAGGVLAAILGPNIADWAQHWYSGSPFVGSFYGLAGLYALALVLIALLPLPPAKARDHTQVPRSYRTLFQQPILIAAIAAGAIGYGIMVLLMTATPLAMQHDGFPFPDITTVIQWHVLGMFVPSFFTGHLIRRFSSRTVILWGCVLLLICIVIHMLGQSFAHYLAGLLLLGVGWNFTFIGGTHLLTDTYKPSEQGKVQGINEFLVFTAAAVGSLFAGQGIHALGWLGLNLASIPFVLVVAWVIMHLQDSRSREKERKVVAD